MSTNSKLRGIIFATALSVFLYVGYFTVYAIPQFSVGQTINPGCGPTDPTCTVAPLSIGDYIKNGTAGSVLFADSTGLLGQDNDNFYWDTTQARLGVGTATPLARVHVDGDDGTPSYITGPTVIVNAGLDKLTVSGSYTGSVSDTWQIAIDSAGTPDMFVYKIISTGFVSAPIPITGGNQLLQDGVYVNFGVTTGYTAGDLWEIQVVPSVGNPVDPLLVSLDGAEKLKVSTKEIRFFDAYTFPTVDGVASQMLTTDGLGNLSWTTPVSGSGFPSGGTNGQVLTSDGAGGVHWSTLAPQLIGYTSSNTALGVNAGINAIGTNNTFLGVGTAPMNTGSYSTFVGDGAGASNTSGASNTFIGKSSGQLNVNGGNNTYVGQNAGYQNVTGSQNTLIGSSAGATLTNGFYNVAIGFNADFASPTAANAIAIGQGAIANSGEFAIGGASKFKMNGVVWTMPGSQGGVGQVLTNDGSGNLSWTTPAGGGGGLIGSTSGVSNTPAPGATSETWLGHNAGYNVSAATAYNSTFIGYNAGKDAINARDTIFMGYESGDGAIDGAKSVFIGSQSGSGAISAAGSIFLGPQSGFSSTSAFDSIFIGERSGATANLANNSIFIGRAAGDGDTVDNSTGGTSILIGDATQTGGFSDSIAIGSHATNTKINQFMIGSATSPIDEITVVLDNSGVNLCVMDITGWTCPSDERSKINIATMDSSLEKVLALNPVLFDWKRKEQNKEHKTIGFIAQEVEKVFPEMVEKRPNGFYGMNYGNLTPVLTKAIQELNLKVEAALLASGAEKNASGFSVLLQTIVEQSIANLSELKLKTIAAAEAIFDKITANILNVKRTETEELCIGKEGNITCITKDELDALLQARQTPVIPNGAEQLVPIVGSPALEGEITPSKDIVTSETQVTQN